MVRHDALKDDGSVHRFAERRLGNTVEDMPGYGIGLLLFGCVVAVFILLLWNTLEMAPSQAAGRRPAIRRRVLAASAIPVALVAAAFVTLALVE
jgi:hypothetical protein